MLITEFSIHPDYYKHSNQQSGKDIALAKCVSMGGDQLLKNELKYLKFPPPQGFDDLEEIKKRRI